MTANQISFYKAKEEAKHYRRQDKESKRHDFATEALNAQELSIKDWANRANVELGYHNAAINRTHYEKSDYNNQVSNQIKTDQLMLDAIETLGAPTNSTTIGFSDYYTLMNPSDPSNYVRFNVEPLKYSYTTPEAIGNYGKALQGVSKTADTVYEIVNYSD